MQLEFHLFKRCEPKNDISLDALVGRLTTFELDNFDNYPPRSCNIESTFKAKLILGRKGGTQKANSLIVKKKNQMMTLNLLKPFLQEGYQKEKVNIKVKYH